MPTTVEVTFPACLDPQPIEDALTTLDALGAEALELFDEAAPVTLVALFPDDDAERVRAAVAERVRGVVTARPAAQADWGAAWADGLRAQAFGPLWIVPEGRPAPRGATKVLTLESGAAFGSGMHATTALCLERIVELSPEDSVLDVGTGSGILALAALALGARHAIGTDLDRAALRVAAENAARNGLTDRFEVSTEAPDTLGRQFSLVVANIISSWLIQLAPRLVRALGSGGVLILSGIRPDELEAVARVYRDQGLRRFGTEERQGWARLELAASW